MASVGIVDLPHLFLKRLKPGFIALADRAREAGQWELAIRLYRKSLDRNPRNSRIWVQYGHALKESGEQRDPDKLAQAEVAYRRALSLDPGAADPYVQLGHVLKLQGSTKQAQACYLRAFILDPSIPYPVLELGALGWSEAQLSELRGLVGLDGSEALQTQIAVLPVPSSRGVVVPPEDTRVVAAGEKSMTNGVRSLPFKHRTHGRYWWFQSRVHDYVPALFAMLTEEEWDIIDQWYTETDSRASAGEANVPALSFLVAMIEGNGISNIVQLGHFEGFSTLLLGYIMRRMGFKHSIFSVDISPGCSQTCEHWVLKAGLSEYVSINVASSDTPGLPEAARDYFKSDIAAVFIDSSHQYQHTMNELNLWFPALKPFGLIFLHDVSATASEFDSSRSGGVIRAIKEWSRRDDASHILLNEDVLCPHNPPHPHQLVYQDVCGLGIIQKRSPPGAHDW